MRYTSHITLCKPKEYNALIWNTCCCCCCVASVVSDSVRPHRLVPTRLPHPWDSPGKNTGVDCHFLLQCMKVRSESEVAQSCPTPSDPMDCSLPGPSVHGTFQARVLEWGAIAFTVETLTYCKMITMIALAHTSIMPHVCFFIVETFKIYSLSNFQV